MTINYNNWGLINSTSDSYYIWTAYPVHGACRRWSDMSSDANHLARFRAHVDTDSSNDGDYILEPERYANPGNGMYLTTGNHSDDWTAAWGSAEDSPQHLTGIDIGTTLGGSPCRAAACRIAFRKSNGSPVTNSIEIGQPYDKDYDFDDDLPAQDFSRSGATRLYLDYDAASSWMMTDILGHTYNRITYGATWRMSFPVCGARE